MGKLIDADSLLSKFQKWASVPDYNEAERHILRGVIAEIEDAPAVDAEPVVHACWEDKCWTTDYDFGVTNHVSIICSACKNEIYKGWKSPFCPNCGAKMDSERRGGK